MSARMEGLGRRNAWVAVEDVFQAVPNVAAGGEEQEEARLDAGKPNSLPVRLELPDAAFERDLAGVVTAKAAVLAERALSSRGSCPSSAPSSCYISPREVPRQLLRGLVHHRIHRNRLPIA